MFSLLDLMRAAQGGAAMNNMARQFGLSAEQIQRAMEALMPAFALGFRRNAVDPTGFANLLGMMGSGQFARFYDQPNLAFMPPGLSEGNQVLGQLFGPEVTRQVAEQTARWTGIAPDTMKQMMPTVATMLMGGLFRSAANQGLADMFEQFADVLRGGRSSRQAAMPDPFTAWMNMLGAMWGGAPATAWKPEPKRPPPKQPAHLVAPNFVAPNLVAPWAEMMATMLGGGQQATPAASNPAASKPPPPPAERPPAQNPVEFFGRMFETGREVQQQHLASLQDIFETCWGGDPKRR